MLSNISLINKNVDKHIEINNWWIITLLDKKKLYMNKEIYPIFGYTAKGLSKRVGKVIKINDRKFEIFRKMVSYLINSKDKNEGNFITKNMKNYFICK